jgi:hypothetical protein
MLQRPIDMRKGLPRRTTTRNGILYIYDEEANRFEEVPKDSRLFKQLTLPKPLSARQRKRLALENAAATARWIALYGSSNADSRYEDASPPNLAARSI